MTPPERFLHAMIEPIGNIPPADAETRFYAEAKELAMVA
jgi:hypothetical protein